MSQPIVIAHHLIWTAYGWWLPNDPRGSTSHQINCDVLAELGELHYGRKHIQPPRQVIRDFYEKASPLLRHELRTFSHEDRRRIAEAFGHVIGAEKYTCYACVVMPDHVHLLIRKHRHEAEEMMEALKAGSRQALLDSGWPVDHPVWTVGGWKGFLYHPDDVWRTIRYIERNPLPLRESIQSWPFVLKYDGWPLHPGHSVNSPYVRGLKAAGLYP